PRIGPPRPRQAFQRPRSAIARARSSLCPWRSPGASERPDTGTRRRALLLRDVEGLPAGIAHARPAADRAPVHVPLLACRNAAGGIGRERGPRYREVGSVDASARIPCLPVLIHGSRRRLVVGEVARTLGERDLELHAALLRR